MQLPNRIAEPTSSCCASEVKTSCCEPIAKASCCGAGVHREGSCGCAAARAVEPADIRETVPGAAIIRAVRA